MKSVMQHLFSQVPKAQIERSSFDRSFGHKTTFSIGLLTPFMVQEALPGDTFNVKMSAFARLATPLTPIMDNMFFETFFFSVPYRLVWDNWVKMNGEQSNPGDSTDFLVPQIVAPATTGFQTGEIADYFGLPTGVPDISVNALPFRAVNLIYDQWFRDQNLQNGPTLAKDDGPDTYSWYSALRRRGKRHDYFTSCLPWTQKHSDVLLPIGAQAPVKGIAIANTGGFSQVAPLTAYESGGTTITTGTGGTWPIYANLNSAPNPWIANNDVDNNGFPKIYADLSAATSAKINSVREAFQLQRMFERDARGGTRYPEIIKAHFGVDHPDINWRSEYLGGGSSYVNMHPVPQNSATGAYADTPQGYLGAYGTFSANNHGFTKSFTEHCLVIGLMCVRADIHYQQGIDRMWSRRTRFDHYFPALAHLGEQAVLNKEIYAQGSAAPGVDDGVFGYQERFAEYRYAKSMVTGKMRSNDPQSLDVWHLAQDFENLPTLNSTFIEENPPLDRCIAVPSEPHFIFDSYIKMICARPMPIYSVPGQIDHF